MFEIVQVIDISYHFDNLKIGLESKKCRKGGMFPLK